MPQAECELGSASLAGGTKRAAAVVKEPGGDGCSARATPALCQKQGLFVLVRHWWELWLGWGI